VEGYGRGEGGGGGGGGVERAGEGWGCCEGHVCVLELEYECCVSYCDEEEGGGGEEGEGCDGGGGERRQVG
jgi:hypothetical protein